MAGAYSMDLRQRLGPALDLRFYCKHNSAFAPSSTARLRFRRQAPP
jgi:hypothetical protein